MHDYGSQYLEKLLYILRKKAILIYSFINTNILYYSGMSIDFIFPILVHLLFIPHELNISDEILDILTPAILLFLSSFYIFQVLLVKVRGFGAKVI